MGKFVVSARKYRPNRFVDVVGQEHVSQTLKNALQNDHLAHAFLFCGPRGVGKTTCARILAKVLNCTNLTEEKEPCNECESCTSFNKNNSFNIVELDAASNNSVEHIRALNEQVRFQPQQGDYKVFIIDEVHMLSQAAFNAFLKTLEEPPAHAVFILATTEKHKIIPTILSRCQIFDFKRIQIKRIVGHLQSICDQENIQAEEDALHIIAQKADGALRDALSIFDRIVSYSGDSIKYADVISNLNVLDHDYFFKFVDAMLVEDMPQVLLLFNEVLDKGFEGDIFITGLSEHLRDLLVCKDKESLALLECSENLRTRYMDQANTASASFLLSALQLATATDIGYKQARNKRLLVEVMLMKISNLSSILEASITGPVLISEKKKIDTKIAQDEVQVEHKETPVENEAAKTVSAPKEELEDKIEQKPIEEATVNPVQEASPKKKKLKLSIGKLSSLESLDKEIEQIKEESYRSVKEISLEELSKYWHEYSENLDSDIIKQSLRAADLSLYDNFLNIKVASNLQRADIEKEKELMVFIRKSLNVKDLQLKIEVEAKVQDTKPVIKKNLTVKERYLQMREVNPKLTALQKRFSLMPDE
ncbi:MAG: DNA polymerase III subunit gamma/tau [Saprospiraceae bacterium]|nr:DNA polymerase III subunit gamma/tau [Saprospiraceae bacterium]